MTMPFLKLIGGLALLVHRGEASRSRKGRRGWRAGCAAHLWAAVRIVAVADIIMSLDNVIAVAAAANGSAILLILGLAISIPMIVAGAALIMALLDRLPLLVWLGAALLGWIAGEVIATDHGLEPILHSLVPVPNALDDLLAKIGIHGSSIEIGMAAIDAAIVLAIGWAWRRKRQRAAELAEAQHAKA
jgi:predicted tellurium resistance membrane protein TerC